MLAEGAFYHQVIQVLFYGITIRFCKFYNVGYGHLSVHSGMTMDGGLKVY